MQLRIRGPALILGALALMAVLAVPVFTGTRGSPMDDPSIIAASQQEGVLQTMTLPAGLSASAIVAQQDTDVTQPTATGADYGVLSAVTQKELILHRTQAARLDSSAEHYAELGEYLASLAPDDPIPVLAKATKGDTAYDDAALIAYGGRGGGLPDLPNESDRQLDDTVGHGLASVLLDAAITVTGST